MAVHSYHRHLLLAVLLLATTGMQAQHRDFAFERDSSAWLTSANAAGLTRMTGRNISTADVSMQMQRGAWADYSQSPHADEAAASVESFFRLSPRVAAYGSMSLNTFSGKRMGGSVFTNPTRMPFDIVEDSLTNLGRKHRDTYRLTGAVGADLWRGLAAGLRIDYTSANYAKYKDLRHKNLLMDMQVSAGLLMPVGPHFDLGAAYLYRRSTESLDFRTYGRYDKNYNSLIAYGVFMGKVEQFGTEGYTNKNHSMPFVDEQHGASLQVTFKSAIPHTSRSQVEWHHEAAIARRRGYYGRRSPYTVRLSAHESMRYAYHSRLTLHSGRSRHLLDFSVEAENLENHASTYRETINDAGSNYYEYYDPVKTANKLWVEGRAAYTGHLGLRNGLPTWTVTAALEWGHRRQTAYAYPFVRRQRVDSRHWHAALQRNIPLRSSLLSLQLRGGWQEGSGQPFSDGTLAMPSDKQSPPPTTDTWLLREYEWLTAGQYHLGVTAKVAFPVRPALPAYISISADHCRAPHPEHRDQLAGTDRSTATLAVGCTF